MKTNLLKTAYCCCLLLLFAAGCKKEEAPELNIVRLPFGVREVERPTTDQVQEALTNGADSVFLVSKEDFYLITEGIYLAGAAGDVRDLTALSPRVSGNNTIINPTQEVADDVNPEILAYFKAAKFRVIPGYVRE
jgi:hypothetical protein